MATILPFPAIRRRPFIRKHAVNMAAMAPETAEKHLAWQLRVQAETMARRGIAVERIEAQIEALERAIRTQLWRSIFQGAEEGEGVK